MKTMLPPLVLLALAVGCGDPAPAPASAAAAPASAPAGSAAETPSEAAAAPEVAAEADGAAAPARPTANLEGAAAPARPNAPLEGAAAPARPIATADGAVAPGIAPRRPDLRRIPIRPTVAAAAPTLRLNFPEGQEVRSVELVLDPAAWSAMSSGRPELTTARVDDLKATDLRVSVEIKRPDYVLNEDGPRLPDGGRVGGTGDTGAEGVFDAVIDLGHCTGGACPITSSSGNDTDFVEECKTYCGCATRANCELSRPARCECSG